MKKLVIWDLDGTLFDTIKDLKNAVNYALEKSNCEKRSLQEVTAFIGNGISKLIERSLPENQKEKHAQVFADFKEYYASHCTLETTAYDGIKELLIDLKNMGTKLAIVSNKADSLSQIIVSHYLPNIFDMVVGERNELPRKPAPDAIYYVLEKLNCKKEETVYIGDSEVDVQTAHNGQIDLIAVSYGYRNKKVLQQASAEVIVDNVQQLREKICHYK